MDTSTRLVEAVREADSHSRYLWADATDLPFEADSFDLVVSYNMLMDVDDVDTRPFQVEVEEDGAKMVFSGWRRPLSAYTRAMEEAGLLIESFLEPPGIQTPASPIFV